MEAVMSKKWTRRVRPSDASSQLLRAFLKLSAESQEALLRVALALERMERKERKQRLESKQNESKQGGAR